MNCVHLKRLHELCNQEGLKVSSGDLVHFVCTQCNKHEVCPSQLLEDINSADRDETAASQTPQDSVKD